MKIGKPIQAQPAFSTSLLSLLSIFCVICCVLLSACSGGDKPQPQPSPVIESLSPSSDGIGITVKVNGKNFGSTFGRATIAFNGTAAVIDAFSDTLIITHVPVGATTGKIKITIDEKIILSPDDFVVTSGRWEQKADVPGNFRVEAAGFSIGNKGYLCGGNYPPEPLDDLYEYDPDLDQWTQKASIPGARYLQTAFVVGDKAYVGLGGSGDSGQLSDFYEYDPSKDAWSAIADFPPGVRQEAIGFSVGTKGYVGLGRTFVGDGGYHNDLWEYDPSTDQWTQMADFPGAPGRDGAIAVVVDGKAYVGMGEGVIDWWKYDPALNSWTQLSSFGGDSPLLLPVGFTSSGKIYVLGEYVSDCWEYDPATDKWQRQTSMPSAYGGNTSFSIGDVGYVTSGTFIPHNNLWKFSPN